MGIIHRLGVKVKAGAKHIWGNKVKIASVIGGGLALGKKVIEHKDVLHSMHSDAVQSIPSRPTNLQDLSGSSAELASGAQDFFATRY